VKPAALALIAATALAAPAAAAEPDAVQPQGRNLYLAHCGKCHLDGGTGTFMLGRRLGKDKALLEDRTDLNQDYVHHVVRHGVNSMPWFTRVELPDAELAAITAYLTRTSRP